MYIPLCFFFLVNSSNFFVLHVSQTSSEDTRPKEMVPILNEYIFNPSKNSVRTR